MTTTFAPARLIGAPCYHRRGFMATARQRITMRFGRKPMGPVQFARRESFLIDPDGRIVRHYSDVDPETHSKDVLADLEALQAATETSS